MDTIALLKKVTLFAGLSEKNLNRIAKLCKSRTFEAGQPLVRQGDEGIGLFIIEKGKVKVVKKTGDGKEMEIATHGPGEFIGEISVLDGSARTASVIAVEATACLLLASWDFTSLMKSRPQVALEILPVLVKRFRETNEKLLTLTADKL